jgi:NAD(P) transhydrogenase subunit alpha
MTTSSIGLLVFGLYVFVLAVFVGYQVITKVPPLLHTLVGSMVAAGGSYGTVSTTLGFIAVTAATINVVGGFMITDRMLRMFKKGKPGAGPKGH